MNVNFFRLATGMLAIAVLAFAPTRADADWTEGFESYANGTLLNNVGGWKGWDNTAAASGTVSNAFAHSGVQSVIIGAVADAVHPFLPGEYTQYVELSAWMYLRAVDHTADTYLIVNNRYNDGGPYTWTSQLNFRGPGANLGTVTAEANGGGGSLPIAYDQWAHIQIFWNDATNSQVTWYNGQILSSSGTWTVGAPTAADPRQIMNIDLFSTGATSYFDDFSLTTVPEPTSAGFLLLGMAGMALTTRRKR